MNKSKFPHDKKQQQHPSQGQGSRPQWQGQNPNQGHTPQGNPNKPAGGQPNKPSWPGQKDK